MEWNRGRQSTNTHIILTRLLRGSRRANRQKGSMKTNITYRAGFTLVEIMIVVAIIGLLAAVAIPNFLRARSTSQQNTCIENLRDLDAAIQQWALENGSGPTTAVTDEDIQPYIGRNSASKLPWCPLDSNQTFASSYTIANAGSAPLCKAQPDGDFAHALPN